jgi:steroid delta-isomerase-like uncharacterized protein
MTLKASDLVRRSFEYFNGGNIGALRGLYAEDSYEQDMATGERTVGGDAVVEVLLAFKKSFPDLQAVVRYLHAAGDIVVAEATFMGTHTAPMEWIDGPLAPTHRKLSLDVSQVFETRDGKIRGIRIYWDTGAISSQLTA